MQLLNDGGYSISDRMEIPGEGVTDFIFAKGWLLEIVELESGEYHFLSDGNAVRPAGRRFGVFYPPFTFVRVFGRDIKGKIVGIGSDETFQWLPTSPFIFETDRAGGLDRIEQAREVLDGCRERQSIEVTTNPGRISLEAKHLIDENYLVFPSIAKIAERLEVSHEHLSRQFKKDYGVSPRTYLHKLRVAEATFRLSLGQEIIEISEDVGYNDLSRFYKQFKKATHTSPAVCRKQLS